MNKQSYVYKVTNNLNGAVYIGKRTFDGNCKNDSYMGSSKKLIEDIKLLGLDNFTKIILKSNLSEEKAFEIEKEYILEYRNKGVTLYNIRNGNNGGRKIEGKPKTRLISVRLESDMLEKVKAEGKERDRSIGFIVNEKLRKAYEKGK